MDNIIEAKTITLRRALLSKYLKDNIVGILSSDDRDKFKTIFDKYYQCDYKVDVDRIESVHIHVDTYANRYFSIKLDNNEFMPCSITRLSGSNSKPSVKQERLKAMRNDINAQMLDFRACNKKNVNEICPIAKIPIGQDAEVDHLITFKKLAEDWMTLNPNATYQYNNRQLSFSLDEPYKTSWQDYHKANAKLRWLSKVGNRTAHLT